MPKIDWNAPGLHYRLQYRRVADKPLAWEEQNITDPTVGMFIVQELSRCELWEFRICAANDEGVGPFSAIEQSFFAPHIPKGKPENVTVGKITAQSVNVSWARVADLKEGGSDGYRVSDWKLLKFCVHVSFIKASYSYLTLKEERELALVFPCAMPFLSPCARLHTNQPCCRPSPAPTVYLHYLSKVTASAKVKPRL